MTGRVQNMKVVVASPVWSLNGVNVFCANLVRGLTRMGVDASIVITEPDRRSRKSMPLPDDIPFEELSLHTLGNWRRRREGMIDYLRQRAPCIYIPNHDYNYSCVSPRLPGQVAIVGIMHSDDPKHYDHVRRLGKYWNWTVVVSEALVQQVSDSVPAVKERICAIRHGVVIPDSPPPCRLDPTSPLRIIYAGRLVQKQKRIFDIPPIIRGLIDRGTTVELKVFGNGWDRDKFVSQCGRMIENGVIQMMGIVTNDQVIRSLLEADVFLLTSEFEGLPITLLEAMGCGCVPVVTDIRSGIPQVVEDGVNGYRIPVGDIDTFVQRLRVLHQNLALRQTMSARAFETIDQGGYRVQDMARTYARLFEKVLDEAVCGGFHRPRGRIVPPPPQRKTGPKMWRNRLRRLLPLRDSGHP